MKQVLHFYPFTLFFIGVKIAPNPEVGKIGSEKVKV